MRNASLPTTGTFVERPMKAFNRNQACSMLGRIANRREMRVKEPRQIVMKERVSGCRPGTIPSGTLNRFAAKEIGMKSWWDKLVRSAEISWAGILLLTTAMKAIKVENTEYRSVEAAVNWAARRRWRSNYVPICISTANVGNGFDQMAHLLVGILAPSNEGFQLPQRPSHVVKMLPNSAKVLPFETLHVSEGISVIAEKRLPGADRS
jgi:hypothetical protein